MSLREKYFEAIDWMVSHPKETRLLAEHINKELVKRNCVLEGRVMPIALAPILLEPHEKTMLKRASERLHSVVNKLLVAARHDERLQTFFTYGDVPREWLDADPGITDVIPISRFDALFDGYELKFIEFNTDNPGGKGWTDAYEEVVAEVPVFQKVLPARAETHGRHVVSALLRAVVRAAEDFNVDAKPAVAFIDYRESGVTSDTEIAVEFFNANGVRSVLCDPRDLVRAPGGLEYQGKMYNTVVRTMKAAEFPEHAAEMGDFLDACLSHEVCLVNPFRSALGSEKSIISAITHPEFYHYLSRDEIRVIVNHVPWTRHCAELRTTTMEGEEVDLLEYATKHQWDLVLKPTRGFGGKGVVLGRFMGTDEWAAALARARGDKEWVIQEFMEIPTMRVPVLDPSGKISLERKYFNLSPYVLGGEQISTLGRVSDEPVVNVSAGGAVVAVYDAGGPVD